MRKKLREYVELGSILEVPIIEHVKGGGMAGKTILDKLSIYIPATKIDQRPVERLNALGRKRDRPVSAPNTVVAFG